jgi:hypothetical protein
MKVLFGSLCSQKPCNESTSYPTFRVRAPSHALCLTNGTAGQQTVQWKRAWCSRNYATKNGERGFAFFVEMVILQFAL